MLSSEVLKAQTEVALQAEKLQGLVDTLLTKGTTDNVSDQAVRQLMTAAVKLYASKTEAGARVTPFVEDSVTATEVVATVDKMLRAVDVELFELGMWQFWGAR